MARTGLGTALNSVGLTNNIVAPRSYNGQEEYEKSLVTDNGARTRQIIKDGLADVLTFGMGALTNLYSPLGLAAGASAVANRHSAMNNARTNYENALNNNLAKYDYLTNSVGVPMPFSRNEVTGNTDFSPYENKVLLDQVAANETAKRMNDIYKNAERLSGDTYDNYGEGSGVLNGNTLITTNQQLPKIQQLTLDTTPATNELPNVQDIANYNSNVPTLQGSVQQNSGVYPVNTELYKLGFGGAKENVQKARGEKKDYYNIDTQAETSRQNNIRSTNASIANNIRSTNASIFNALNKEQKTNNNNQAKLDAKELAKQQELEEIQKQLNNFQNMFDKVPNKIYGSTIGAGLRKIGYASTNEANFDAQRTLLFNQIARKLGGEKGVLSDGDIKRIEKALPTLSDSFEQRNAKMKAVYDLLDIKKGNSQQFNDPLGIR